LVLAPGRCAQNVSDKEKKIRTADKKSPRQKKNYAKYY
jgi:hypothetical protein